MQTPNVIDRNRLKAVFGKVRGKLVRLRKPEEIEMLCMACLGSFTKTKAFLSGKWDYDTMYDYILDSVVVEIEKSTTALRYLSSITLTEELDIELGKVRYLISKGNLSTWLIKDINGLLEPLIKLRNMAVDDDIHVSGHMATTSTKLYVTRLMDI